MIYINDETEKLPLDEALAAISEQRRQQALKFSHEQGRRLSVAAYLLLKEGLSQEFGIDENPIFGYDEHGKPHLEGHADIHFNMSHCRAGAICALSTHPVGVDMETVRDFRESLVRYTMNAQEMEQIQRCARPDVAFTALWTKKEALLKLSGEGIRTDMRDVLGKAGDAVQFTTVVNLQKNYVYTLCEYHQAG